MLGNVDVLERRHPGPDGGGGEHVALGVPAEPPDLVPGVGGGGVPVQDPVRLGQAQPAHAADAGEGLLLVYYLPIN